jgi:NAD(P)-dependent dehydrogenase (short-subunit alcohol dehydrogenase family)
MQSDSLKGRTAVVTGGARGIGDAIVRALAEAGAGIVSLDKIAPEEARPGVTYLDADVSDPASVAAAFAAIDKAGAVPDILVNNAGIQRVGLIGKLAFEEWQAVIGTHLTGFFLCASQAVPRMVDRGKGGAIISIASTAGFVGIPGRGPYCAAKAGIMGLTRTLALEVAGSGIRVNAVAPGYTRTKLIDQALKDGSLQEEWMMERVPLGRLATPEEIAGIVRFLAGPEAAYITGQVIVADGGWTIQGQGRAPGWLTTPRSAE